MNTETRYSHNGIKLAGFPTRGFFGTAAHRHAITQILLWTSAIGGFVWGWSAFAVGPTSGLTTVDHILLGLIGTCVTLLVAGAVAEKGRP